MSDSPNLAMPYIEAAQAQKHVTHNEALRILDTVAQLSVIDRNLSTPPGSPEEGDRYLVAASATGAWSAREDTIAAWQDGAWSFHVPRAGWLCWVADEMALITWDGEAWIDAAAAMGSIGDLEMLGINAIADETNRLSVSSAATLLNHEGEGHQLKINKNLAADTASLLYQTDFSGRAEMGLTGDDDFHFKVSADGTVWNDAIIIDRTTGEVDFPNTVLSGGGSIDADDIDDSATTHKFTSAGDISKLAAIEAAADVTDTGNVGSSINGATGKATPVDADTTSLIDSEDSNALKKLTWANLKATLKTYFDTLYGPKADTIEFVIDGGGSAIATGIKGDLEVPFACTITRATALADQSGSMVVDIWKDSYANYPPSDADSITSSAPVTISTATKAQDATLTGWGTSLAAGDILRFNVDSITSITRVTISLLVTK